MLEEKRDEASINAFGERLSFLLTFSTSQCYAAGCPVPMNLGALPCIDTVRDDSRDSSRAALDPKT